MPIEDLTPHEAHALRQDDPDVPYVDVRSIPEFTDGHPEGAFNVPLLHFDPTTQQMRPNPEFQQIMETLFPKEKPVILGCKTGGRSAHAAALMEQLGYATLYNVLGGFHGTQDEYGNVYEGWLDLGLPTASTPAPGRDYGSLTGGI